MKQKLFFSRREAAAYLNSKGIPISHRTLEMWACRKPKGRVINFYKLGHFVRYKKEDLDAWIEECGKDYLKKRSA